MGEKLYRDDIFSSEYACCLSTIVHIGDNQFCDHWQWIKYGEAHEVNNCIIFIFKSVLTYEVFT
jgi:hypothetical protein